MKQQGPVVPRPISAWPRVKFNPGFFFLCSKAFSRIIFSLIFRASNHQLVDKRIKTEILFNLSNLNSNLALTLGYLNPALNNSAQVSKLEEEVIIHGLQPRDKAAMLVVSWWSIECKNGFFFSRRIYMKIGFSSQRGEMLSSWPPTWPPWRHVQTSNYE